MDAIERELRTALDLASSLGDEDKVAEAIAEYVRLKGERRVLAELLRDATAVLRAVDPEDATEGEQLEALIGRAEKAYGAILETPN